VTRAVTETASFTGNRAARPGYVATK
jgi:hypothetical protein